MKFLLQSNEWIVDMTDSCKQKYKKYCKTRCWLIGSPWKSYQRDWKCHTFYFLSTNLYNVSMRKITRENEKSLSFFELTSKLTGEYKKHKFSQRNNKKINFKLTSLEVLISFVKLVVKSWIILWILSKYLSVKQSLFWSSLLSFVFNYITKLS